MGNFAFWEPEDWAVRSSVLTETLENTVNSGVEQVGSPALSPDPSRVLRTDTHA